MGSLRDADALAASGCLPLLQELHLGNARDFCRGSGGAGISLLAAGTQLTSLAVSMGSAPRDNTLSGVLSHCSALRRLDLSGWRGTSLSFPTGLTGLQELVLTCPIMAPGSMLRISSWSRLQVLRGVRIASRDDLAHMAMALTALTNLDFALPLFYHHDKEILSPLSLMSSLKVLSLSKGNALGKNFAPVASLTQLASLTVGMSAPWTIVAHFHGLAQLRFLDLSLRDASHISQVSLLLGMNLGSLTRLGFEPRGSGANSASDVLAVLGRATGLVSLRLGVHASCVGGGLANVISTLVGLTHLEFTEYTHPIIDPLAFPPHFVSALSSLSTLKLDAFELTRDDLQEIAGLSRLTRLHLTVRSMVAADDVRCLGKLINLEALVVRMRRQPLALRRIDADPCYPIPLYERAFDDLQAARRAKGWQDLKVWKRPCTDTCGQAFTAILWGLPGHEWDDVHGFLL